jgi:hypothetical protein
MRTIGAGRVLLGEAEECWRAQDDDGRVLEAAIGAGGCFRCWKVLESAGRVLEGAGRRWDDAGGCRTMMERCWRLLNDAGRVTEAAIDAGGY